MPRRRASIRLWQTALFIIVIVVAMLILSGSLSAALQSTLIRNGESAELRNASALARRLEPQFPVTVESMDRIRAILAEYRGIYGGGIWVYDRDGTLLEAAASKSPSSSALERARVGGITEDPPYAHMDLVEDGWVIAARTLHDPSGARAGVVITASSVAGSLEILNSLRSRLWVTFWVSLVVAGLLGFALSQLISTRIIAMTDAAAAISAGDFEQRLPTGLVPDEVRDLAMSYNSMATRLGEAFGAIQESRRQIAAVVESMAEGVVSFDSTGVVRVANPEAIRLLEREGDDIIGTHVGYLTEDRSVLEVVLSGLNGMRASRTATLGECIVWLNATPMLDVDGAVDGAVLLLADVTEQRRIEEAQRRFIADASHEMRTPVAALKGMLELLADGAQEVPEVREDFIRTMQVEADRLGRLVGDMLTLAQLEAGSLRLKPEPQSPADLLGDVSGVLKTLAEEADVTLSVEAPDGEVRVIADRDKTVQVLLSFTDNAIKHSPAGATVHLAARLAEDQVVFEVADEGSGIESGDLARVFERFYRADEARTSTGGTGLGLAIAKEIVEAQGSSIEVESSPGHGTTFAFRLPVA